MRLFTLKNTPSQCESVAKKKKKSESGGQKKKKKKDAVK
jgi:hypothetical protein